MNSITIYESIVPLLAVVVSMVAIPLILISSSQPKLREFWTLAASIVKFSLVFSLLPGVLDGKVAATEIVQLFPNISLSLKADALGVFFGLISSFLWIITSIYSIGYVRILKEKHQARYFASFALCISSTLGIAFAGNLLTFIIFYELLTVATYPLVIHKGTTVAIKAGRKYLVYTLTAGVLLVAAIAVTSQMIGQVEFQAGGISEFKDLSPLTIKVLFVLFVGGLGVKAAIIPLHSWLPTAMIAPTPVSALLHAVAVVKSGVFGIVRLVGFVFGPEILSQFGLNGVLVILAGFTILVSSLLAFSENNLKGRLAYSTISHLSYIVMGAALMSPSGLIGGLLHIVNHAILKITLFFCAGAIYVNFHKEKITELNGIGRAMPWTMGAFTLASIGLVGIPPVNGFMSKWYLGLGALESGQIIVLIILLISGLLNAGYFFPIVYRAFFKESEEFKSSKEASKWMVVPLVFTAVLSILIGVKPDLFFKFFPLAVQISQEILGV
ncbi:MAG: monovalent cation/H+ antiporter subunit D family protein [Acidobacteriia bacterium]|nr:monovalent cation/H+ antiporter subunit D family protein [Terriglobia bacterium]